MVTQVVLGSTGHLGRQIVSAALGGRQKVVAATRRVGAYSSNITGLTEMALSPDKLNDPNYWSDRFLKHLPTEGKVVVTNAMGGAHPAPGVSLRDHNRFPVLPALEGLLSASRQLGIEPTVVSLSSTAASDQVPCEYARVKHELDHDQLSMDFKNIVVLRVGYTFDQPVRVGREYHLAAAHAYSISQLALLPMQFMIGDGSTQLQPVSNRDLAQFVMNAHKVKGKKVIGAVGPDVLQQKQLTQLFCDVLGTTFIPLHLSIKDVKDFAKQFPFGHLSEYAVNVADYGATLYDPKPFEEVLGRPLTTISSMLPSDREERLVVPYPPVLSHAKQIVAACAKSSDARKVAIAFSKSVIKELLSL